MINQPKLTLEYKVAKYGPSGVGSVELYYTRDDGHTWQPFGGQIKVNVPPPSDTNPAETSVRRSLMIELPEEGTYGLYMVVKSGAGLGKPPPQPGEPPQMRVQLDMTMPVAKLYKPEPDPTRPDSLVILWDAKDRNLTDTPVTLEWANSGDGPWNLIGPPEHHNTGRYVWQVPPNTPSQVYMRLTVRDTAGNVTYAVTPEPVLIDLVLPEVIILDGANTKR
jgi:hypothetical protein